MGGSFGGMMMRHANRLSGWGSNDPRNVDAKPRRKKHPDDTAARKELDRIRDTYIEAKRNAMKAFHLGVSKHCDDWVRAGFIRGDESVRELVRISREL